MNYVIALIDRAKGFVPKQTEYGLCQALGMPQHHLIAIKKGRGFFGPKQRVRLHEITRIPLEEVTAMLEFERAKKPEDKEFWRARLPRISAALVIGIATAAATFGHMDSALASDLPRYDRHHVIHYAQRLRVGTMLALQWFLKFCASQELNLINPTTRRGSTGRPYGRFRFALRDA